MIAQQHPRRPSGWEMIGKSCSGILVLLPFIVAAQVQAQTQSQTQTRSGLRVDAASSVRASSNPFLIDGTDRSSTSVVTTLSPRWTLAEPSGSVTLAGIVRHTEYLRRYVSTQGVDATATSDWRLTPTIAVKANLGYRDAIAGEAGIFDPGRVVGRPIEDVTLAGTRTRSRQLDAGAGVTFQSGPRDQIGLDVFASRTRLSNPRGIGVLNNYSSYGQVLSVQRRTSDTGSIGASFGLMRYECAAQPTCHATIAQPQATLSTALDAGWLLDLTAGAAISKSRLRGIRETTVSPSGSARLCRNDPRNAICVGAQQQIEQNAINGSRPTLSAYASWRYQLTPRDSIAAYLGYTGLSVSGGDDDDDSRFSYWNARVTGSRAITERISLTVEGAYFRNSGPILGQRTNLEASMGIRFSLGRGA